MAVVLTVVVLTHSHTAVHMAMLKITEEMRAAARKLLSNPALKFDVPDRDLLTAISDGKRKLIKAHWWKKHFVVVDRIKLDKLQRMADPARNPMEHERATAGRKLDAFRAGRPPGMPPEPPPLPKVLFGASRSRGLPRNPCQAAACQHRVVVLTRSPSAQATAISTRVTAIGLDTCATTCADDGQSYVNSTSRREAAAAG